MVEKTLKGPKMGGSVIYQWNHHLLGPVSRMSLAALSSIFTQSVWTSLKLNWRKWILKRKVGSILLPILKGICFLIFIGKLLLSSFETIRLSAGCEYTLTVEAWRWGVDDERDIHIFSCSFRPVRRQCPINRRWVWRMVSAEHPRTCHRSLRQRRESHWPRCDSDCDKSFFSCEYFHWYPLNPFWYKAIVIAAPYEYPLGEQWDLLVEFPTRGLCLSVMQFTQCMAEHLALCSVCVFLCSILSDFHVNLLFTFHEEEKK